MTDPTPAEQPKKEAGEQPRKRHFDGQPLPDGERAAVESVLTEHGVARVLDELAQLCDDMARRPTTSRRDYHIYSLLSMQLGDQVALAEKVEHLQEGS